jgi:hypothetical protein
MSTMGEAPPPQGRVPGSSHHAARAWMTLDRLAILSGGQSDATRPKDLPTRAGVGLVISEPGR